ncbi:3-hydroxyacyl-CoA dehydrogenase NAD-binding domain-containing protein [Piscirickettsia salmonis]|uniref:3-hydroxyacyl-CoA dehydrogenase NAD-binding domain-containing protein n=1 Tax=Piscirickettsia salmonis TaxID=1238 RepID=UPI0007C91FA5|nr:Fatty acid oxidation complex subunit alpha [Piscirickettsiaceae bacterium NZ-RLO1]
MSSYSVWQVVCDSDQILWLSLDCPQSSTNTLGKIALAELATILIQEVEGKALQGIVIQSAKPSGFIAGADVHEFSGLENVADALDYVRQGQAVFNKLENIGIPTVALIHGFCLGGGLELALACRYRIASDSVKTRLGLPEVMLGIQPAWGGTVRLPERVGSLNALDLMLTGRTLRAQPAKKQGLVDQVVAEYYLAKAAKHFILSTPSPKKLPWTEVLTSQKWARPWLAKWLIEPKLREKARSEHYPAPFQILSTWQKSLSRDVALNAEITGIEALAKTEAARNLVRIFLLQERLKAEARGNYEFKRVHVVGAGTMGGDIAAWCLANGLQVTLQDPSPDAIAGAFSRTKKLLQRRLRTDYLIKNALDQLTADPEGVGVGDADVIIEAIVENVQIKQTFFEMLEQEARADAVLATNTSSIPLDEISKTMKQPERLVGIHFFNPVAKMKLVEIVCSEKTAVQSVQAAKAFAKRLDRIAVEVKSTPGFLINRILLPYLLESVQLFEEGVRCEDIDEAALAFGMPMGPVTLADQVGLDVCLSVAKTLCAAYGGEVPKVLQEKVEQGHLGVKAKRGFYEYREDQPVKSKASNMLTTDIQERLIMRLLNESVACWDESIVIDADVLDLGMIFGTGFAPFRGGPAQYAKQLGHQALKTLESLSKRYGARFQAHPGWQRFLNKQEASNEPNQEK